MHASIHSATEVTKEDMLRILNFSFHSRIETVAVYVDHQKTAAAALADLLGNDLPWDGSS